MTKTFVTFALNIFNELKDHLCPEYQHKIDGFITKILEKVHGEK